MYAPFRQRTTGTTGARDRPASGGRRHEVVGFPTRSGTTASVVKVSPVAGVSSAPPIVVFSSSRARAMASAELAPLLDADGEGRGVSRGRSLGRSTSRPGADRRRWGTLGWSAFSLAAVPSFVVLALAAYAATAPEADMSRHVAYDRGRAIRYAAMASAAYRPRELLTSWGAHARGDGDGDGDDDLRLALSSLGGPDERRFLGADASVSVLDVVDVPSEDVRFYLAEVRDATGIERPRLALVFRGTADETPDDWLPGGAFDGARGRVDADFDFDLDLERDETRRRDPGAGESFGTLGERASESGSRASEESSAKSRRRRDPLPVHAAFYRAYAAAVREGDVRRAVSRRAEVENRLPISIVGHSVGGALAHLAALDLATRGFDVAEVWTFGAPRVGGRRFAAAYDEAVGDVTWRVVNRGDVVADIPGFPLYHHVGAALACEREEEDGGPGPVDDEELQNGAVRDDEELQNGAVRDDSSPAESSRACARYRACAGGEARRCGGGPRWRRGAAATRRAWWDAHRESHGVAFPLGG
jgi:hypothetical protein